MLQQRVDDLAAAEARRRRAPGDRECRVRRRAGGSPSGRLGARGCGRLGPRAGRRRRQPGGTPAHAGSVAASRVRRPGLAPVPRLRRRVQQPRAPVPPRLGGGIQSAEPGTDSAVPACRPALAAPGSSRRPAAGPRPGSERHTAAGSPPRSCGRPSRHGCGRRRRISAPCGAPRAAARRRLGIGAQRSGSSSLQRRRIRQDHERRLQALRAVHRHDADGVSRRLRFPRHLGAAHGEPVQEALQPRRVCGRRRSRRAAIRRSGPPPRDRAGHRGAPARAAAPAPRPAAHAGRRSRPAPGGAGEARRLAPIGALPARVRSTRPRASPPADRERHHAVVAEADERAGQHAASERSSSGSSRVSQRATRSLHGRLLGQDDAVEARHRHAALLQRPHERARRNRPACGPAP